MLDPTQRIDLPELPSVVVYRDHESKTRFYAVPARPRVARDVDVRGGSGRPQVNLLVYTRKRDGVAAVAGGQVSATIAFSIDERERQALVRLLTERFKEELGGAPAGGGRTGAAGPVVVSPDWLGGEAGVRWTADFHVRGTPSMMGENACTLSTSLGAEQAAKLRDAWEDGLKDARIYFRMEAQAASVQRGGFTSSAATGSFTFQANLTESVRHPVEAEGPLGLSRSELNSALQVINL